MIRALKQHAGSKVLINFSGPGLCRWLITTLLSLSIACVSSPSRNSLEPAWVRQSSRTVDAGYIVYVSVGEDKKMELALFKGEAAAIQDIANECSFAPKGTRIEDRYHEDVDGLNRYYVKIGVSFDDCDLAKKALEPSDIKQLANAQLAKQLKEYEDLVSKEAMSESKGQEVAAASSPASTVPSAADRDFSQSTAQSAVLLAGPGNSPLISNQDEYFATRQRIFYLKQGVILAPATAYQPSSPQTVEFVRAITPVSHQVVVYEYAHPEIRTWSQSWSHHGFGAGRGFGGYGRPFGGGGIFRRGGGGFSRGFRPNGRRR